MATPLNPEETTAHAQPALEIAQPTATAVASPPITSALRARRAGRTLVSAGILLVLLFFSPFVSCGSRTMTGVEAFQESLPGEYSDPQDGLFIIIFPAVGLVSALAGYMLLQRLAAGEAPRQLRAFAVTALVFALLTLCPIAAGFSSAQINSGRISLEWGFYASLAASLAVIWAGLELINSTGRPPLAAGERHCPGCGEANPAGYRFCTRCGTAFGPPPTAS